jgi:rubrerythrin
MGNWVDDGHGYQTREVRLAAGIEVPGRGLNPPLRAGLEVKGEFRCAGCGYGISIYSKLPRCPMCGTESWEQLN